MTPVWKLTELRLFDRMICTVAPTKEIFQTLWDRSEDTMLANAVDSGTG